MSLSRIDELSITVAMGDHFCEVGDDVVEKYTQLNDALGDGDEELAGEIASELVVYEPYEYYTMTSLIESIDNIRISTKTVLNTLLGEVKRGLVAHAILGRLPMDMNELDLVQIAKFGHNISNTITNETMLTFDGVVGAWVSECGKEFTVGEDGLPV